MAKRKVKKRKVKKMARRQQTAHSHMLDSARTVTYHRSVLVTNPNSKFENSRFGICLSEERGAGETYREVYLRLKAAGNDILAWEINEFLSGRLPRFSSLDEIKRRFGLWN